MATKKTIHLLDFHPGQGGTQEYTVKPGKKAGTIIIGDDSIKWADVLVEANMFNFNRWEHGRGWEDVRPDWLVPFDIQLQEAQKMVRNSGVPHWCHATGSYGRGVREGIMSWLEDGGLDIVGKFVSNNRYGQCGIWSIEEWQVVHNDYVAWCMAHGIDTVSVLDTRFAYECGHAYRLGVR